MTWKQLRVTVCPKRCRQCRWYEKCSAEGVLPRLRNGCNLWELPRGGHHLKLGRP